MKPLITLLCIIATLAPISTYATEPADAQWAETADFTHPFGGYVNISVLPDGWLDCRQFAGSGIDYRKTYIAHRKPGEAGYTTLFYAYSNGNGPFIRIKDGKVEYAFFAKRLRERVIKYYPMNQEGADAWKKDIDPSITPEQQIPACYAPQDLVREITDGGYPFFLPATEDGAYVLVPQFMTAREDHLYGYDLFVRNGDGVYEPKSAVVCSKPVATMTAEDGVLLLTATDGSYCKVKPQK